MPIDLRNIGSISPNGGGTITLPGTLDLTGTPAPEIKINGVPIGGGAAQTPWESNIDAAQFRLNNIPQMNLAASASPGPQITFDYNSGVRTANIRLLGGLDISTTSASTGITITSTDFITTTSAAIQTFRSSSSLAGQSIFQFQNNLAQSALTIQRDTPSVVIGAAASTINPPGVGWGTTILTVAGGGNNVAKFGWNTSGGETYIVIGTDTCISPANVGIRTLFGHNLRYGNSNGNTFLTPQARLGYCGIEFQVSGNIFFYSQGEGGQTAGGAVTPTFRMLLIPPNSAVPEIANGGLALGLASGPSYLLHLGLDAAAKPGTNTWTIVSDMRTKRNSRRFEGDIEVIRRLDPTVAEYNGKCCTPEGRRVVSFEAEKLREILPQCVSSTRGKLNPDDTEEVEVLGINTHEIFFHMLRAVQQLDARLKELEKRR